MVRKPVFRPPNLAVRPSVRINAVRYSQEAKFDCLEEKAKWFVLCSWSLPIRKFVHGRFVNTIFIVFL